MNIGKHYQGDSLELVVPITDQAGTPYPLESATLRYEAWPKHYVMPEPITLTVGDGITVVEPENSKIRINVPAGKLDRPVVWLHKLLLVNGPLTQTLWQGEIRVVHSRANVL